MDRKVLKHLSSSAGVKSPSLWCWESSQELDSNNFLITKLQPLCFLWILRCLDKWHLGVTEHFIWKHIWVVQDKIELIEIPSEQQRKMDISDNETTVIDLCLLNMQV